MEILSLCIKQRPPLPPFNPAPPFPAPQKQRDGLCSLLAKPQFSFLLKRDNAVIIILITISSSRVRREDRRVYAHMTLGAARASSTRSKGRRGRSRPGRCRHLSPLTERGGRGGGPQTGLESGPRDLLAVPSQEAITASRPVSHKQM